MGTAKQLLILAGCLAGTLVTASARTLANACPEADVKSNPANLVVSTPALKYTVTNFDPSWFDTNHPDNAPTLFTVFISPNLAKYANQLRLRVEILADTSLGRQPSSAVIAFDRITGALDATSIGMTLTSNKVFGLKYELGGTAFDKSPFYDIILDKHQTPEMNLIFKFNLTCEDNIPVAAQTVTVQVDSLGGDIGKLRYVKTIQALYPGTRITNPSPVSIYTLLPIFKVVSELFNTKEFDYPPDQNKMEIFIYEVAPGENPQDAMDGIEFAKFGVSDESPVAYPAGQPRLEPGKTYAWRARALLRGPTSDYLYSNPLYFKIDERLDGGSSIPPPEITDLTTLEQQIKFGDDYSKRLMAALKIILGDNFEIFDLSRASKVPAKGQIRLNGHPYTLDELERLAREFTQSKHSVTRLRFQ